jgi:ABC-type antimicrobial peptide transport system permease subunit
MVLTASGLAIGLAAAFVVSPLIASRLYGVTAMDPFTCGGVALLLAAAALLAGYGPARRASKVNPVSALRHD